MFRIFVSAPLIYPDKLWPATTGPGVGPSYG